MNENKTNINWFPGHMAKTRKQIIEQLNLIDIVYEVVDARMPLSSKMKDIDDLIKDKPKIMIMTKYDLCDQKVTNKCIEYYQSMGYIVVPMDLKDGNLNLLLEETDKLIHDINLKRLEKGLKKRNGRVLIMGVPNVGKSTLINRLVGKKSVVVGNTPGVTKNLSWIRIQDGLELMDSPGVLWPKLDNQEQAHILAAFSSIKEEILNLDDIAIFILKKMYAYYPKALEARYGITSLEEDFIETYEVIAKRRGAISRGGVADYEKVSYIIIKDLNNGYLGKVTFDRLDC